MLAEQPYASIHTLGLDLLSSRIVSMIGGLRDELNIAEVNKPDYLKKSYALSIGIMASKASQDWA